MRKRRASERLRQPQPLLLRRVPSGRGAMEQPNVTDDDVPLTARFWAALLLTGVGAGLIGAALMLLLFTVADLAFGPGAGGGNFQDHVAAATPLGRVLPVLLAGVIAGGGFYLVRRYIKGRSDVDDTIWTGDGELGVRRSAATSVVQEIVVGLGASVGREAAPRLMSGVCGSVLAQWTGLSTAQRRLLVACGAGAGFAAVYNVPLGGALLTAEVLLGVVRLPVVLPALACSSIATLTAWVYLPAEPTYHTIPDYPFGLPELVWSLPAGLIFGLVAVAFVRLIGWVSFHRPRSRWVLVTPLGACAVLGALGLAFPQLYGNGKDMAEQAFLGNAGMALFLALFLLKPLVTALCLGSGISGGLFTPTLATGAVLGAFLGKTWSLLWPGAPTGAYAMIGAAAFIGAATQAPLAGLVLVLELTHSGLSLMVPMIIATVLATAIARWIDGYSIYSARLEGGG